MTHSRKFMKMSRRIIMAVILGLILVAPPSFAAQEVGKVGVVEFSKIWQQLPETKQAQLTLQATVDPLQKELARLKQDYQQSVVAYNLKAPALTKAVKEKKEKELNLKGQIIEKYQQDNFGRGGVIEKKDMELAAPIRQKIATAIEFIAQKEGFTLVFEKSNSFYVTPENDLTFKVLNQLNIK